MRPRVYFLLGDIVSNAAVGGLTAWVTQVLVPESWSSILAMGLGMFVGMGVALASAILFVPLFGALEVMLPTSLTGMLVGMGAAMLETMHPLPIRELTLGGMSAGLGVVGWTYYLTAREKGAS